MWFRAGRVVVSGVTVGVAAKNDATGVGSVHVRRKLDTAVRVGRVARDDCGACCVFGDSVECGRAVFGWAGLGLVKDFVGGKGRGVLCALGHG